MAVAFTITEFDLLTRFKAYQCATSIQTRLLFKVIWFSFPFHFATYFVKSCFPARLTSRRDYKSTHFQICCSSAQIQSHFTSTRANADEFVFDRRVSMFLQQEYEIKIFLSSNLVSRQTVQTKER